MSNALNDVIVVSLDVRIWSGRKKLRPEDLTASGKLPPKDLVSLGSKKIFDPKALKRFVDVKRRAETRCQAIGVRFARAFAIPKAAAKSVIEELNRLAENFREVREAFLATYDEELARWKAQHPGYERLIEAELLPKAVVGSKFAFGYDVFAINAVDGDHELAVLMEQGGAGNLTLGLTGALYEEVASESREFVRQSLTGRHEVTQKFLRPVRAIREKLAGLAFLDPGIAPLVGSIDEVLASTPQKGKIDGASLAALRGVVTLLTDPARMREHGRVVLEGNCKGLLADPGANNQEIIDQGAAPPEQVGQEAEPSVPTAKPARVQRASAFW
jgi:hypothetical protein